MTELQREIVAALEGVGHLEEAEQLREEWTIITDDETRETRSGLVYVLAKTIEQKLCSRAQFPCTSCVMTAQALANIVTSLGEKMAIHTFINVAKDRNIVSIMRHSFKFAVNSLKKKLLAESSKLTWGKTILPIITSMPKAKTTSLEIETEEYPLKIVRISTQNGV